MPWVRIYFDYRLIILILVDSIYVLYIGQEKLFYGKWVSD